MNILYPNDKKPFELGLRKNKNKNKTNEERKSIKGKKKKKKTMVHEAKANGEFLPGGGEGHFSGYVRPCLKGQARGTLLCFLPVIIDFYIKYQESKLSTGGSTLGSISEVSL